MQLEDLANELIYEIFDYLDTCHVYEGFFNLNTRFQNILIDSTFPIHINISLISKSKFHRYYIDFIQPDITKCSQLQTLVLNEIDSQSLENLLIGLTSLNNLSSLSIHVGRDSNKITIYNLIFHLSILKHCKISFEENVPLEYLPMSKSPSSSIEHLIINDNYNLNEVEAILSYVPHIRRLSIEYQHRPYPQAALIFLTVLNNLTHVCVTGDSLTNVGIEQFIKNYFRQIKVLHISANQSLSYSGTWLKPILSYLPHVHVFDFADRELQSGPGPGPGPGPGGTGTGTGTKI
ncbi:unnamed protein product [Rotaria sp. Silwood2]|nr:unnamed protein product [Rotaria sp. Silwood2]